MTGGIPIQRSDGKPFKPRTRVGQRRFDGESIRGAALPFLQQPAHVGEVIPFRPQANGQQRGHHDPRSGHGGLAPRHDGAYDKRGHGQQPAGETERRHKIVA